jgi:hypothetical protein
MYRLAIGYVIFFHFGWFVLFDFDRTRALEQSKEQQRPRKRLQGTYLILTSNLIHLVRI